MTNEELALRIAVGEEDLIIDLWEQVEKFVNWQVNRFSLVTRIVASSSLLSLTTSTKKVILP